eukprot:TRINITY_DN47_c0_g1_i1.p1 TRINITY_DN47_c0_g1~~TRINITY_DN47_c0_g1_i1.p1  ORF type:complete len:350 (-),score=59.61 TRINITY_DN47_c0_g1_i1:300-1349(-)
MSNLSPATWRLIYVCGAISLLFLLCVPWMGHSGSPPSSPFSPLPPLSTPSLSPSTPSLSPSTPSLSPSTPSIYPPTVVSTPSVSPALPSPAILLDCSIDYQLTAFDSASLSSFATYFRSRLSYCFGDHPEADSFSKRMARIQTIHNALNLIIALARGQENIEGFSAQVTEETAAIARHAIERHPDTICEIGFNGGHSSATWLVSADAANYYGFDMGTHPYSRPTFDFLSLLFLNRMHLNWGDSTQTLPAFAQTLSPPSFVCDIGFVDGGHFGDVPHLDLTCMLSLCDTHSLLMMDDVRENTECTWCVAPTTAWNNAVNAGLIIETDRLVPENATRRGLVTGRKLPTVSR